MSRPKRPFPDSVARFREHMPKGSDLTLIVLKSHLLAEAEMNELLELLLPHPEHLYRSRFTFMQRLRILEAISTGERFHAVTKALEVLNEMRNALAHQLSTPQEKDLAAKFTDAAFDAVAGRHNLVRSQEAEVKVTGTRTYSLVAFKQAIAITIGQLALEKKHAQSQAAA